MEGDSRETSKKKDVKADLNNWLPVTSSRNGKWWYSAFHNVTAMVGAGVLGLPYAMSELGWYGYPNMLTDAWLMGYVQGSGGGGAGDIVGDDAVHAVADGGDARAGAREEAGPVPRAWAVRVRGEGGAVRGGAAAADGADRSEHCVHGHRRHLAQEVPRHHLPFLHAHQKNLFHHDLWFGSLGPLSSPQFQLRHCHLCRRRRHVLQVNLYFLIQQDNKRIDLRGGYSTIAWVASANKGVIADVQYTPRASTDVGRVFQFFCALGDVAFAYAGHNVVLEIQATIPSTPEKPSNKPMMKGVWVAYAVVFLCYFPVAIIGYWVFGNSVEDNILVSLQKPAWLIAAANMFVVIHVIGSYQVFAMPLFDTVEGWLVKSRNFKPTLLLRICSRTIYVALTCFLGCTFPFFGGLLGFFGGFAFAPTTYFLPCIIWLKVKKPKVLSLTWFINVICIVTGVALMVLAPIGALRQIILQAKDYKFYS
nr:putative amino acid transporter, transmembrane domain-containing protein [Ipomoea trifida]